MTMESEAPADTADNSGDSSADPGVSGLFADARRLAEDARTLAQAELAYQTSRAVVAGQALRSIALYGAAAAVLAVFALVALTVGLLLALVPLVTAWGATAIVAGGLALTAGLCAKAASRRWRRARNVIAATSAGAEEAR